MSMLYRGLAVLWLAVFGMADPLQAAQLTALALQSPNFVIPVKDSDLSLLSQPNRDHFTLIVLTSTDEKHQCTSCFPLHHVLRRVAAAWAADYAHTDYLFIAEIDIVDRTNVEVFNYLGLRTVPQIWLIPPSHISATHRLEREVKTNENGEEYFDVYDILLEPHAEYELTEGSIDDQVFHFADWLAKTVQKRIMIRQENPVTKFAMTFGATFGLILFIKKKGPSAITGTVTKARIYKVLLFLALLLLLGGYLFTTIQGVPFMGRNEEGDHIFVSGGIHYQFGIEMFIVAASYFLLAANLVLLVFLGQYKVTGESAVPSQNHLSAITIVAAGTLYLLYSVLTSLFLRKDEGYPYYFLKLF